MTAETQENVENWYTNMIITRQLKRCWLKKGQKLKAEKHVELHIWFQEYVAEEDIWAYEVQGNMGVEKTT